MMRQINSQWATSKEYLIFFVSLILFLTVTGLFVGLRTEHFIMALLAIALFLFYKSTRKLLVALLPFVIFGVSYDWMRICPNYEINPIDVRSLYEAEKAIFGIATASDGILTPNEFFNLHNCAVMDFMSGCFYLCWVPVPILFGLWLYFKGHRSMYLHFAMVFLLVNIIGFIGYYIHPAAPPWYAMNYGFEPVLNTPGNVAGLGRFDAMTGLSIFQSIYGRNANVFAAVPSLHAAYMVVALAYAILDRRSKLCIVLFAFIMVGIWFTAVYSGHHYLIDVLLGITCALIGVFGFECGLMRLKGFRNFVEKYVSYIS